MYVYVYMCVCVCVCVSPLSNVSQTEIISLIRINQMGFL
jgi:hypothetical protein